MTLITHSTEENGENGICSNEWVWCICFRIPVNLIINYWRLIVHKRTFSFENKFNIFKKLQSSSWKYVVLREKWKLKRNIASSTTTSQVITEENFEIMKKITCFWLILATDLCHKGTKITKFHLLWLKGMELSCLICETRYTPASIFWLTSFNSLSVENFALLGLLISYIGFQLSYLWQKQNGSCFGVCWNFFKIFIFSLSDFLN